MKEITYCNLSNVKFFVEWGILDPEGDWSAQVEELQKDQYHWDYEIAFCKSLEDAYELAKSVLLNSEYNYAEISVCYFGENSEGEEDCYEGICIGELWADTIDEKQTLLS